MQGLHIEDLINYDIHTTMMIMAGEPIRWISAQMGHSSVMHTLDIYSRWIYDDDPTSGDKASKIYSDIKDEIKPVN